MNENKKALAGAGTPTGATETAALGGAAISCLYSTTPATVRQVAAHLPVGASNAISGKELAAMLGYKSLRCCRGKSSENALLVRRFAPPSAEIAGGTI